LVWEAESVLLVKAGLPNPKPVEVVDTFENTPDAGVGIVPVDEAFEGCVTDELLAEIVGPLNAAAVTVTVDVATPPLLSVAVIVKTLFDVTGPIVGNHELAIVKLHVPEFCPAEKPLTFTLPPLGSATVIVLTVSAASESE
jgi:hypothetical protein